MTGIEIDSTILLDFMFVEIVGKELEISCNHCMAEDVTFFKGEPHTISYKNWLVDLAAHLRTVHPSSLRK